MPRRLARPCRHYMCPRTTTDPSGYCEDHRQAYIDRQAAAATKRNSRYRAARTDYVEQRFYNSKDWRETSKQYKLVHPTCCKCGRPVRIVHHSPELPELLARGLDPLDWQYLSSLCWGCHERTKTRGRDAETRGN